jgi:hypothetical protein
VPEFKVTVSPIAEPVSARNRPLTTASPAPNQRPATISKPSQELSPVSRLASTGSVSPAVVTGISRTP